MSINSNTQKETTGVLAAQYMKEIAEDTEMRMSECTQNVHLLAKGIFYSNKYLECLEKCNQTKRIDYFHNKNFFFDGYVESKYWIQPVMPYSATNTFSNGFYLSETGTPSLALDELSSKLSLLDCKAVVQLCLLKAIRKKIGLEKMNLLFKNQICLGATDNIPEFNDMKTQYEMFFHVVKIDNEQDLQVGDLIAFANNPKYLKKHEMGEDQNINCLVKENIEGKVKYAAHGISSAGLSKDDVLKELEKGYNLTPLQPAKVLNDQALEEYGYTDSTSTNFNQRVENFLSRRSTFKLDRTRVFQLLKGWDKAYKESKQLKDDKIDLTDLQSRNQFPIRVCRINEDFVNGIIETPINRLTSQKIAAIFKKTLKEDM